MALNSMKLELANLKAQLQEARSNGYATGKLEHEIRVLEKQIKEELKR